MLRISDICQPIGTQENRDFFCRGGDAPALSIVQTANTYVDTYVPVLNLIFPKSVFMSHQDSVFRYLKSSGTYDVVPVLDAAKLLLYCTHRYCTVLSTIYPEKQNFTP